MSLIKSLGFSYRVGDSWQPRQLPPAKSPVFSQPKTRAVSAGKIPDDEKIMMIRGMVALCTLQLLHWSRKLLSSIAGCFVSDGAKLVSRMKNPSSTPHYADMAAIIIVVLVTVHFTRVLRIK